MLSASRLVKKDKRSYCLFYQLKEIINYLINLLHLNVKNFLFRIANIQRDFMLSLYCMSFRVKKMQK